MLATLVKSYVPQKALGILKEKLEHSECRRGIKAVQKSLASDPQGIAILAADVSPFDLVSHIPGLCLENKVPLVYIASRFDVPTNKQKPTTCMFIPSSILTEAEAKEILSQQ
ncbi:H/ACA ribonucleoprotein complex subunit 2 [Nematocida displodere]|uniref:H/ACA ribonucleoprotein complex subunit 2 n=1 Tax=Nematocida displodere TaxID=1805483 RepID=A0A177EBT2_9MICR|nr:H/ACA ribonucleoprotein complex subunit 2 [Nematocida displodere]